jgi:predicted NACHT family NTPase
MPVAKWPDPDEPLTIVTKELRKWANALLQRRAAERSRSQLETQASRSADAGLNLTLYFARARAKWEAVDLTALAQGTLDEEIHPTLAQVFIPQDCRRARPPQDVLLDWLREQGLDPEREEAQRDLLRKRWDREERLSALDLLASDDARHLVLLGAPGSGKSSLARFVLLELLRAMPPDELRAWRRLLDGHIPFLVELRDLIALDAPGKRCSIPAYLADMGSRLGFGFTAEGVEAQVRDHPCLLIVDGLDEIFDPVRRRDIGQEIVGLATRFPATRILVTSRIAGFEAALFEQAGFAIATLDELSDDQVESFARAWFDLAFPGDPSAAERKRTDLLETVARRPQLRAIAGNPLSRLSR